MKIVIDEDLSRSLGQMLQELGYEVLDIRDCGLRGAPDEAIYNFAQKEKAVLFSGDLGFANTVRFPIGSHCGIVILRFPNNLPSKTVNDIVRTLLVKMLPEDYEGNLVILSPHRLRMRRR